MKAVLLHTDASSFGQLAKTVALPLAPLLNKPIAQHQIERAYQNGIREIVLIASDGLNEINAYFGDGTRFGVRLTTLIGQPDGDECRSLFKHRFLFDEPLIVMSGLTVCDLPLSDLLEQHQTKNKAATLLMDQEQSTFIAAILTPKSWDSLANAEGDLLSNLKTLHQQDPALVERIELPLKHVTGNGLKGLLDINRRLLRNGELLVHNPYIEIRTGIFVGRNANIHPKAKITPPVLIGHHSQIMPGAEVGPDAVIGDNTIVARKAHIESSVVLANSYIGEMTRLDHNVVSHNLLFGVDSDFKVVVSDPFLLGNVSEQMLPGMLDSLVHRSLALGLFVSLAPFGVASSLLSRHRNQHALNLEEKLGSGKIDSSGDVVYLPRFQMMSISSKQAFLQWWPSLVSVMKGDMRLIGPRPLTPEQAENLNEDWMLGRFATPPGITGIADLSEDEDESRIAEALYAKKRSLKMDARIALAKLASPLIGRKRAKQWVGL